MKFSRTRQEIIDSDFQGVTINYFTFENHFKNSNEVLQLFLLHDTSYDRKRDCIKHLSEERQRNYLVSAFNFNNLKIEDFKKSDLKGLYSLFEDLLKEDWWGNTDKQNFLSNINQLKDKLKDLDSDDSIYLLSKDWIETEKDRTDPENADKRLKAPDFWCFDYYFLFIVINNTHKKIIEIEIFYE